MANRSGMTPALLMLVLSANLVNCAVLLDRLALPEITEHTHNFVSSTSDAASTVYNGLRSYVGNLRSGFVGVLPVSNILPVGMDLAGAAASSGIPLASGLLPGAEAAGAAASSSGGGAASSASAVGASPLVGR